MPKPSRFDYVRYDEVAQKQQDELKAACTALEQLIERLHPSRARELAFTKLEEAYMWCGKAVRDEQISRNCGAELQEERKNS
jgi:hypothetical protein